MATDPNDPSLAQGGDVPQVEDPNGLLPSAQDLVTSLNQQIQDTRKKIAALTAKGVTIGDMLPGPQQPGQRPQATPDATALADLQDSLKGLLPQYDVASRSAASLARAFGQRVKQVDPARAALYEKQATYYEAQRQAEDLRFQVELQQYKLNAAKAAQEQLDPMQVTILNDLKVRAAQADAYLKGVTGDEAAWKLDQEKLFGQRLGEAGVRTAEAGAGAAESNAAVVAARAKYADAVERTGLASAETKAAKDALDLELAQQYAPGEAATKQAQAEATLAGTQAQNVGLGIANQKAVQDLHEQQLGVMSAAVEKLTNAWKAGQITGDQANQAYQQIETGMTQGQREAQAATVGQGLMDLAARQHALFDPGQTTTDPTGAIAAAFKKAGLQADVRPVHAQPPAWWAQQFGFQLGQPSVPNPFAGSPTAGAVPSAAAPGGPPSLIQGGSPATIVPTQAGVTPDTLHAILATASQPPVSLVTPGAAGNAAAVLGGGIGAAGAAAAAGGVDNRVPVPNPAVAGQAFGPRTPDALPVGQAALNPMAGGGAISLIVPGDFRRSTVLPAARVRLIA